MQRQVTVLTGAEVVCVDGVAVATDLHTLLDRGDVSGPFVLVGHSSGAQYVRIFAGRYPEQVSGMVSIHDVVHAVRFATPVKTS